MFRVASASLPAPFSMPFTGNALRARGAGVESGDAQCADSGVNGVNGVNGVSVTLLKAELRSYDAGKDESQMSSVIPGEEALDAVPVEDNGKGVSELISE